MSPTEIGFVIGLGVITVASYLFKKLVEFLFIVTLTPKDEETLNNMVKTGRNTLKENEISSHSTVLVCIKYFLGLSCFFNSAFLAALLIRSMI